MFAVHNRHLSYSLVIQTVIFISCTSFLITAALSVPTNKKPPLAPLTAIAKAKKCANITCIKPPVGSNCYIPPKEDIYTIRRRGPKADCCKVYRCFRKNGVGFTFHAIKGGGPNVDGTEVVHFNKYKHHSSVPKNVQELSKAKDTKQSVSSVATGAHDSTADAGAKFDQNQMDDILKEFGFADAPSDNKADDDDLQNETNNPAMGQNNDPAMGLNINPNPDIEQMLLQAFPQQNNNPEMETSNNPPIEASNNQPMEASNNQPMEASNNQPMEASNNQPMEASNNQPMEASNNQPTEASNNQPIQTSNNQPIQASNNQPIQASNNQPIQASNNQPIQASNNQPTQASNNQSTQASNNQPIQASNNQSTQASNNQPTEKNNIQPKNQIDNEPKIGNNKQTKNNTTDNPKNDKKDIPKNNSSI